MAPWLLVVWVGCSGSGPGDSRNAATLPPELDGADPLLVEFVEQSLSAVATAPDDALAWRRLGMVYQANRLFGPATDAYQRAVALDPADARVWYGLGVARAQLGLDAAALEALDRVVARTDYPPAFWRKGFLLLDAGRLAAARAAFEEALAHDGDDLAAQVGLARVDLSEGAAPAAVARLEPLVANAGPAGQDYLYHLLGLAYRQAGRLDDAAVALGRGRDSVAVWRDPWNDEILGLRRGFDWTLAEARRAMADGRSDLALPVLEQLRERRPHDRELLVTLGSAYAAAGADRRATEAFRVLAREHADDYRAHRELSRFHDRGRRLRQALEHAERAVALNEAYAPGWRQLAVVLRHQSRPEECARAAREATTLTPTDAGGWQILGDCRMDLEQWAIAADAFERAVVEAPRDGDGWSGLAMASARAGRTERAKEALERLRGTGPGGVARADTIAESLGLANGARP